MRCVPGFPHAEITPGYVTGSQTPDLSPDPAPLDGAQTCLFQEALAVVVLGFAPWCHAWLSLKASMWYRIQWASAIWGGVAGILQGHPSLG